MRREGSTPRRSNPHLPVRSSAELTLVQRCSCSCFAPPATPIILRNTASRSGVPPGAAAVAGAEVRQELGRAGEAVPRCRAASKLRVRRARGAPPPPPAPPPPTCTFFLGRLSVPELARRRSATIFLAFGEDRCSLRLRNCQMLVVHDVCNLRAGRCQLGASGRVQRDSSQLQDKVFLCTKLGEIC